MLTRRHFIRNVSVAGGALSLGFSLTGCSTDRAPQFDEAAFSPNAFLRIDKSGRVTVQIHKAEMGQGVVTGIITLIAEELEVAPESVHYEMAPVHAAYADPEMMLQITGGSASMRVYYDILRLAGATARETLVKAASRVSGEALDDLYAEAGQILSRSGHYSAAYGELVATAVGIPVPTDVRLKSAAEFKLIGRYDRRLDSAPKVDGSAQFGIDVQLDDALVAVVIRNPHFGGKLVEFNAEQAKLHPGVFDIFTIEQGIAVVAEGYWQALKAAEKVDVSFVAAANSTLASSEDIERAMSAALAGEEFVTVRDDGEHPSDPQDKLVSADYRVPFLAHATMEPQNATALVTDDHCEVWVGSQAPDIAQDVAARLLGLPHESVTIHNQFLGCGFGRRAVADNVAEVVAIAAQVRRPVKLIWSREDDTRHDFYRPAMAGHLSASVAENGDVSHWHHRIVGPSINQQLFPLMGKAMLPNWMPTGILGVAGNFVAKDDFSSVEGAKELPYEFNAIKVQYHNLEVPVPLGFWRSVGHSHSAFIVESFVDELAAAVGHDPLLFRRRHLPQDSRQRRVLDAVAELSNWGDAAAGRFQGIAVHQSFGSVVAQVAEVSLIDSELIVERFYCVIDCGQVINPDIVRDQMEGAIAFGLTAALYGEITLEGGAVTQSNFNDYPILRHNEMPEVVVSIIDSSDAPSGVGEPGTPPVAPALANAIFAANGQRLRQLPLRIS